MCEREAAGANLAVLQLRQFVPCPERLAHAALRRCPWRYGFRRRNVVLGEPENRILMTGLHTVVDAACAGCRSTIGWHYLHAYEPSESYKIGLFVLEKVWLARSDAWVAPVAGSHASDRRLVFRPRPAGVEGAAADDASGRAPLRGAVFV